MQHVTHWVSHVSQLITCVVLQMQAEREAALLEREAAKQQAAYLKKAIEGVFTSQACLPIHRSLDVAASVLCCTRYTKFEIIARKL